MRVKIRLAKAADIKTLSEIYIKAYSSRGDLENWNMKSSLSLMKYFFRKQPDIFFVAETEGKIVGAFVAIVKPWWDGNHLFDGEFFVDPAYQKKGVGSLLLKTGLNAASKKYNAIVWEATTFKKGFPITWYKRIGFDVSGDYALISGNIKKVLKSL